MSILFCYNNLNIYFRDTKYGYNFKKMGLFMKVLFSPSEAKSDLAANHYIDKDSFCCKNLYEKRMEVIDKYQDILNSKDINSLNKIFGLKDENRSFELAKIDIKTASTCKAVQRYTGVAYNYLDYENLSTKQKDFIDNNAIIFSNLFGPILAKDKLPIYRLKQGATLKGFKTEEFYKKHFSDELDKILKYEFIMDLRAGFYEKFYKIPYPYITLKFIKNGKVISHWAKAYRGVVLRQLAISNITSIENFRDMQIKNLEIEEIQEKGLKTEFIYNIS